MLFPIAYISLLLDFNYTKYFDIAIIISSYYLIFVENRKEPVLYLIMFSRCINGFIVPNSPLAYSLVNLTTCYLPISLLFVHSLTDDRIRRIGHTLFTKYKFTTMYLAVLIIYTLVDMDLSTHLITKRLLPMVFFLMGCLIYDKIDFDHILLFFRYVFASILLGYFVFDYVNVSRELLANAIVFKEPLHENQFFVLSYFRDMGVFWDTRILGIFSYTYLYIALIKDGKLRFIDISLSVATLVTSMSRGSILVGLMLIVPFLLAIEKGLAWRSIIRVKAIARFGVIVGAMVLLALAIWESPLANYASSFWILSENSAVNQRAGFRNYAMEAFRENPLGHGIGYLKSPSKERSIEVGDMDFDRASDAFLFIVLGEMGFIGLIFFILSTIEILYYKNIYSILLLVGYFIQLIGTDVPDMGVYYFVFLLLISRASSILQRYTAPGGQIGISVASSSDNT